ncbi:AEC family transporter [Roseomonas fluvialis]|uniref:Permease n=1 Tax=Roseomonas fluvialis TaxID=1750527 RepID=A0ABM7Y782_9PROT|nr:AEC family transporter [Roseomonas fluvialis]BDG73862.1 permease [Roseomonas fluvialis]
MAIILEIVAPVFAIVAMGWAAAAWKWVDEAGFRSLIWFTFTIASPALLFAGGTSGNGGGGPAALAFFLAALVVYGAAMWIALRQLSLNLAEAGLFALNCTFGNTVMMGIPLTAAAYGQAGVAVLLALIALHSMVLLSLGTIVAEFGIHRHAPLGRVVRATLGGVLRNPIVMSVVVALAWSTLALPVPSALRRTLELLGASSPPLALFCLGGSLASFRLAGSMRDVAWALVLKLAVLPLLVWGLCIAFALGPLETAVAVTTAALPTGANAFMLARRYAVGAERSGATVLVSTVISVFTVAAVLAWFRG